MLVLRYWTIFFLVLPHFIDAQARKWEMQVCLTQAYSQPIKMTLNKNILSSKCSNTNCFSIEIKLDNGTTPYILQAVPSLILKAIVQNHDLQEAYGILYGRSPRLRKWVHWSIEVTRKRPYGNYKYTFQIEPSFETNVEFRQNSKTSNKSFFLPMEMNDKLKIKLLTKEKIWMDTDIELKNLENSKTYSCIYLKSQINQMLFHECSLVNDSMWKMELTSRSRLIRNVPEINILLGEPGTETDSLLNLTLKKLAHLPTFVAFPDIGKTRINELEIYFNDSKKAFDIDTIVMARISSEEEYGCSNIHKTIPAKYSCRLVKSKNWQLRIISSGVNEQTFFVEIIQDTQSFFSRGLNWPNHSGHGQSFVEHFNLKTYEYNKIKSLKLHFMDKSFQISEIRLLNNESEYKFEEKENVNKTNSLVKEFTRITQEDNHPDNTNIVIAIGLLAVILLILIIIIIVLSIRIKMLRNSLNTYDKSTHEDTGRRNDYLPMKTAKPVQVAKPNKEVKSQPQNPEDVYENTHGVSTGLRDSQVYEELK